LVITVSQKQNFCNYRICFFTWADATSIGFAAIVRSFNNRIKKTCLETVAAIKKAPLDRRAVKATALLAI
jgi:hypothetical protein